MKRARGLKDFELAEGAPVVLHLQGPKEKIWGLLVSLQPAGVVIHGLDLVAFEDWLRQEARAEERILAPTTVFYPMYRVEKMEGDDSVGPVESYCDRFAREVGKTVRRAIGLE